jgi:hypothetical protein
VIDTSEKQDAIPLAFGFALLVSFLFGLSISFARGFYSDIGLAVVVMALCVLIFHYRQLFLPELPALPAAVAVKGLIWTGLLGLIFTGWNDGGLLMYPAKHLEGARVAQAAIILILLSYLPAIVTRWSEPAILRNLRVLALAAMVMIGGIDVIRSSPRPPIDVWAVQQQGAVMLLEGKNPYQYLALKDTDGLRHAHDVPYVYPPFQLLVSLPAYRLLGDVRYAMLLAILITGAALRWIVQMARQPLPSVCEDAPALFFWLCPKLFFILEQAWVDPIQVMLISLTVVAHVSKRPIVTAVLMGLTLTAKQTMFWMVGLGGLMFGFTLRQWLITALTGAASVLPFALWNFEALQHATYSFVNALPARPDALTLGNWVSRTFAVDVSPRWAFPVAGAVAGLSVWKLRGSVARFAVAVVLTYAAFFVINKWAFANYYFLLMALAALAAACAFHGDRGTSVPARMPAHSPSAGQPGGFENASR